jgi:hypothetical protein
LELTFVSTPKPSAEIVPLVNVSVPELYSRFPVIV